MTDKTKFEFRVRNKEEIKSDILRTLQIEKINLDPNSYFMKYVESLSEVMANLWKELQQKVLAEEKRRKGLRGKDEK